MDHDLEAKGPASKPVVTHDRTYHVPDRRPLPDRRDGYEVMEVAPRRRKERRKAESGDWRPLPDGRDGYEVVEFAPRRRKERRAEGGEPDSRKVAPRRREERRAGGGDRWRDSLPLRERQLAREG